MIKQLLEEKINNAVAKITNEEQKIELDHPVNINHGDYTTTIAFKLAKISKKNPLDIADKIISYIEKGNDILKIEVLKPGFINFWINNHALLNNIKNIINHKINIPTYHFGKQKKIMVEFAHPNTHKLFHIGHLRNISTGESIVRILEAVGNKVIRSNYQGDVGLHIAKCLWGIKNFNISINNPKTLNEKIGLIGKAYTAGTKAYETDEKAKKDIIEINRMIYNQDSSILQLWKETRQWSLEYYNEIYKRVDSHFDRFYFESELSKRGIELCQIAEKKRILSKSQNALVFIGKKYGLDTRVFINSLGFPTYEGKELALSELEFSEFGEIDKCIHVVTPEQSSFFKVTFKVEELLNEKKFKDKQIHLIYEWVQLKGGKMSSRQGNIVEGNWLIDEAKNKIKSLYKSSDEIAETLAVGAIKYSFLKHGLKNSIAFDFDESITLEGNSAPYLIYTYVRCQSVLKKQPLKYINDTTYQLNNEELILLRILHRFPEIVNKAGKNFSPNYIATYLFNLAQQFNLFYQKYPILKTEPKKQQIRLMITQATGIIIKQGLYLLGIKTVEKM